MYYTQTKLDCDIIFWATGINIIHDVTIVLALKLIEFLPL